MLRTTRASAYRSYRIPAATDVTWLRHFAVALLLAMDFAGAARAEVGSVPPSNAAEPPASLFDQRVTVGIEPIGFPMLLPAFGAAAGYYLRPDLAVELSHARNGFDVYVLEVYTRVTTLRLKKYWTESFYTNAGLGVRTLGARFSLDDIAVSELDAESEVTSLVGDLSIGNRWAFGRLALGCDWLGWMPHLRVLKSHDRFPYDRASDQERAEKRSRFDNIASRGTPQFLRFYVGTFF